jgi:hypothetical protein
MANARRSDLCRLFHPGQPMTTSLFLGVIEMRPERIEGNASSVFVLEGDTWKIRSETVEVTKKEVSTQSPTSVRAILGRSARVAPASPIPTTENRYAAATFLRPPLVPFGFTGFSSNGRSDRLEVVRTRFPCEGFFPIRVELNGYPISGEQCWMKLVAHTHVLPAPRSGRT